MATNNYTNILRHGLQSAYDALGSKDSNVLYFCTDTGKIYKGSTDFSNMVITAASKSAVTAPVTGKLYIFVDTETVETYVSGAWKVVSYPVATTIAESSDDNHVVSAKAVWDALKNFAGSSDTVKTIVASTTTAATIDVTAGDDTKTSVLVPGVATKPDWDATARKLTFHVTGDSDLEITLGKDIFLDPAADNKYNTVTKNIELYLNDGTEGTASTKIEIPAGDLVDVYTGETKDNVAVTVSDDNKISVALTLDPDSKNILVNGTNGFMVDGSVFVKQTDYNAKMGTFDGTVADIKTTADAAKSAITVLNGDASTVGSVAKAVKDASDALDTKISALDTRVGDLETDLGTAETNISDNTTNIASLATATTTWGTF